MFVDTIDCYARSVTSFVDLCQAPEINMNYVQGGVQRLLGRVQRLLGRGQRLLSGC